MQIAGRVAPDIASSTRRALAELPLRPHPERPAESLAQEVNQLPCRPDRSLSVRLVGQPYPRAACLVRLAAYKAAAMPLYIRAFARPPKLGRSSRPSTDRSPGPRFDSRHRL